MKIKLLFFFLIFYAFANAQITVTNADMATLNDTVRFSSSATDISAMLNDTGANRTWNFRNLIPDFQDIKAFKSAISVSFGYAASFSTSSYGTQDPDINFTLASATNVFTFYKNSTTSYVADGRGITISGLPVTQPYIGKDQIYKFPLNYSNKDSNSYYTDPVNLLVATLTSSGKRVNTVDGWGTITTGYGTFNCIRVKSMIQETDTVRVAQLPFPIPVAHNSTEYKWIAKGQKIPILYVSVPSGGLGATTTIEYRDVNRPEVFKPLANFAANKTIFAANSTDTCILTSSSPYNPKAFLWTITPNTFSFTGGTSATSATPKIFFKGTGSYSITLKVTYNAGTDDTTRSNYISVQQGPTANFGMSVSGTATPVTPVYLYDSSTGSPMPTTWKWTFVPNKVSFIGGTKSNSQNPILTFDSATNYAITLTATNAVGNNSVTKYLGVYYAGVNELNVVKALVSIYPNPTHGTFEITSDNNSKIDKMEITDITGKNCNVSYKFNSPSSLKADCSSLSPGIYFVKTFLNDGNYVVSKITVQ